MTHLFNSTNLIYLLVFALIIVVFIVRLTGYYYDEYVKLGKRHKKDKKHRIKEPLPDPEPVIKELKIYFSDPIGGNGYCAYINQFIIDGSDISHPGQIINMIGENGMQYPVRFRISRDILRPLDLSTHDMVANSPDEIIDICKTLVNGYNIQHDIVIQELPASKYNMGGEYILSCKDGVIDALYQIHYYNKRVIEQISLKNLDTYNKKFLRNILYAQHKKLNTVRGVFDIGFFTYDPKIRFDKSMTAIVDPMIIFVGIAVSPEPVIQIDPNDIDKENIRSEMISYPYVHHDE